MPASPAWTQTDTTPPALMDIPSEYNIPTGRWRLYVNEPLDQDSVPAKDAFQIWVGGVVWGLSKVEIRTYGPFGNNRGRSLELTLSPVPTREQVRRTWRLVYTPPAENPLQDLAGNRMEAFDTSWGPPPGSGGPPPGGGGGPPPPEEPEPPPPPPPPPPPVPPTAAFSVDVPCDDGLCRARTGEDVLFTDTSSGTVSRRSWDFDVATRRAPSAAATRHAWSSPGFYRVTLTVSGAGAESTASRVFLVEAADPAGTCVPDGETICLRDSRYQVRATWRGSEGELLPARAAHAGTNDSGLFWFHDAENWEALVKVLDGCAINGAEWVFVASSTDLGYSIRVTDTATGAEREYHNEPGRSAVGIADAMAFPEACSPD